MLEYADGMTQTPVEVSDTLFAKLHQKFTPPQLVELTVTLAWENYRARFDHAFGVEAEGFTEGSYCALPAVKETQPLISCPVMRIFLFGEDIPPVTNNQ